MRGAGSISSCGNRHKREECPDEHAESRPPPAATSHNPFLLRAKRLRGSRGSIRCDGIRQAPTLSLGTRCPRAGDMSYPAGVSRLALGDAVEPWPSAVGKR